MKSPKNKDFDRCMKTVLKKCGNSGMWADDSLSEFCKDYVQRNSLSVLALNEYIRLISADDSTVYSVIMLDRGYEYFAEKEAERKEFIKSFFSNFLTGFLSGVLVSVIGGLILNRLI